MSRRYGQFLMALALVATFGIATAGPASAASLISCAKQNGTVKITPGLVNSPKKAQTVSAKTKLTSCSGHGVTSGVDTFTMKTGPLTCANPVLSGSKVTGAIKWNNKKTSTFTGTTKTSQPTKHSPSGLTIHVHVFGTIHTWFGNYSYDYWFDIEIPDPPKGCSASHPLTNGTIAEQAGKPVVIT